MLVDMDESACGVFLSSCILAFHVCTSTAASHACMVCQQRMCYQRAAQESLYALYMSLFV